MIKFKPLKLRIRKSDLRNEITYLINENTRLHDRLKSLEAIIKVLVLAKVNLETENLKLHNKIVEHVRIKAEMQRKFTLEKNAELNNNIQIENESLKEQIESLKRKKSKTKK